MRSIERKQLEQCDAVVIVIDLHAPAGSAMVAKLGQTFPTLVSTVSLTRQLRCNYLVVINRLQAEPADQADHAPRLLLALPCFDQQALKEGLEHAHKIGGQQGEVGYLLLPDSLMGEVGAVIAIMQAKVGRPPRRRPT